MNEGGMNEGGDGDDEGARPGGSGAPKVGRPRLSPEARPTASGPWERAAGAGPEAGRPAPEPRPRGEDPSFDRLDPTAPPGRMTFRGAPVTVVSIVAMSLIELAASADLGLRYRLIDLFAFQPLTVIGVWEGALPATDLGTLVGYIFLHGGLMHLLFNMLGFAVLGPPVERALGAVVYALAFVAMGVAGGLGQFGWDWTLLHLIEGRDPRLLLTPLVGASGAIFGLLGLDLGRRALALAALPPSLRRSSPARYLLGASSGVVIINLVLMVADLPISGAAHLGGFVLGLALAPLVFRRGGGRVV